MAKNGKKMAKKSKINREKWETCGNDIKMGQMARIHWYDNEKWRTLPNMRSNQRKSGKNREKSGKNRAKIVQKSCKKWVYRDGGVRIWRNRASSRCRWCARGRAAACAATRASRRVGCAAAAPGGQWPIRIKSIKFHRRWTNQWRVTCKRKVVSKGSAAGAILWLAAPVELFCSRCLGTRYTVCAFSEPNLHNGLISISTRLGGRGRVYDPCGRGGVARPDRDDWLAATRGPISADSVARRVLRSGSSMPSFA